MSTDNIMPVLDLCDLSRKSKPGIFILTNMSKNRYINTKFWDDDYISELEPLSKLVFLYLLTNANTNIAGVYEITIKRIAYDTGIDRAYVKEILNELKRDGKIDREGDYVALANFFKHQDYKGKRLEGAKQIIDSLPEAVKKMPCIQQMQYHIDTLYENKPAKEIKDDTVSIQYQYHIDTISPNSNSNSNLNSNVLKTNNKSVQNFEQVNDRLTTVQRMFNENEQSRVSKTNDTKRSITYPEHFESMWNAYTKKGSKKDAYAVYKKLSQEEIKAACEHIPKYVAAHVDKRQYMKDFERYLDKQTFYSEIDVDKGKSLSKDEEDRLKYGISL